MLVRLLGPIGVLRIKMETTKICGHVCPVITIRDKGSMEIKLLGLVLRYMTLQTASWVIVMIAMTEERAGVDRVALEL